MEHIFTADLSLQEHADATVWLLNEYAKDDMGGGSELTAFAKHNLIAELKKRPNIHVILAFVDGNPAGLALCIEGFSSFDCKPLLNIHDFMVASAYRGRGLSKRLLGKVEETAIELGCSKLTLEVLEGNHVAQSAYRAFGFNRYELRPEMGKAMFWQKKI
ncbi:GNAT family N-acetyltransferase [Halothiobacillus sp.]|uniref:GNAT family N-acetyltransferase n=1 Tax=Halothiobacillus sp. TaxID=1891311 RepID=UPI00262C86DD|nr:GNAT family N-acetyltransferase [Halothiobacillus sp.]MDD4965499.1 GNAT family N-acetyltransferase [Halothiobacillus sp.]